MDNLKPTGTESSIRYLERTLLPAILEMIEESGISCSSALAIPQMLEKRIKNSVAKANEKHAFTVADCWKRKQK